jgi:hypothetical protein
VYVGEVVTNGSAAGSTVIDPADIGDRVWAMAAERTEGHRHVAG